MAAPTDNSGPGPKTPRSGRWLRVALVVSLGLNLLVAGLVAGALLAHGPERMRPAASTTGLSFGGYTAALSREDRAALRAAFVAGGNGFGPVRGAVRAERRDLLDALRGDPFDPDAVSAVLARQRARLTEGIALGQRLLLDRILAMDPAARGAFADRLEAVEHLRSAPRRRGAAPDLDSTGQ